MKSLGWIVFWTYLHTHPDKPPAAALYSWEPQLLKPWPPIFQYLSLFFHPLPPSHTLFCLFWQVWFVVAIADIIINSVLENEITWWEPSPTSNIPLLPGPVVLSLTCKPQYLFSSLFWHCHWAFKLSFYAVDPLYVTSQMILEVSYKVWKFAN